MKIWEQAREFAIRAHGDQKYSGSEPYVAHLDEVAEVLREFHQSNELTLTLAYLHDVVEDTSVTLEDLADIFNQQVSFGVAFLTDEPGLNRKERKANTHALRRQQIQNPVNLAVLKMFITVKLADRIANLRRSAGTPLMKMYLKERDAFRQAYYHPEVDPLMWVEYDRLTSPFPIKMTVETSEGTKVSLSGERLERYLEDIRKAIVFAQANGPQTDPWGFDKWDVE